MKATPVCNEFTENEEKYFNNLQILAGWYMLKALTELGINNVPIIIWPNVTETLKVLPEFSKFLRYILLEMLSDGYFQLPPGQNPDNDVLSFIQSKKIPEFHQIGASIADSEKIAINTCPELWDSDIRATKKLWNNLANILKGHGSALGLLFDNTEREGEKNLAEVNYLDTLIALKRKALHAIEYTLLRSLSELGTKSVIRILEVGAGVGSSTMESIKHMMEIGGSCFHYTYTDLSPGFLQNGETLFKTTDIEANFAILDINEDPLEQGFIPHHYDIIIASWVLHATKDLEKSVSNLKMLLKPHGYLLLDELHS